MSDQEIKRLRLYLRAALDVIDNFIELESQRTGAPMGKLSGVDDLLDKIREDVCLPRKAAEVKN